MQWSEWLALPVREFDSVRAVAAYVRAMALLSFVSLSRLALVRTGGAWERGSGGRDAA